MSNIAIKVSGLSKRYRLGEQEKRPDTLAGVILGLLGRPLQNLRQLRRLTRFGASSADNRDVIWALKNISFEVKRGEVMGVIGPNGSGKSTLLKILSQITYPTEGRAEIYGRIASLLEVGTGFHPELTGRENVYLNSALLGMGRSDIAQKFDEIVEFSGVEKFIDTPIKRYSSGMRVRLAFSVAAHLEPEILLIDEVLAVGDADFQKRCLGKMRDVAEHGRTVLFVSHNMQAIARLCHTGVLLESGRLVEMGSATEVVTRYIDTGSGTRAERVWEATGIVSEDETCIMTRVAVKGKEGQIQEVFDSHAPVEIEIGYELMKSTTDLVAEISLFNTEGILVFVSSDQYDEQYRQRDPGKYKSRCVIPGNLLTEGTFYIRAALLGLSVPLRKYAVERDAVSFRVVDRMGPETARGVIAHNYPGIIRPRLEWEIQRVD